MKFGKLPSIEGVDFTLPPDPPGTEAYLARLKNQPHQKTKVFFGCPVWTCKEWVGDLFPPKTKPAEYLQAYSHQLTTVELNSMFYRIPREKVIEKWRETAPATFRFCPKVNRLISQYPDLTGPTGMLDDYIAAVTNLQPRLGMTFLQLPPAFGPQKAQHLRHFLQNWPAELDLAVEFRHPEWFESDFGFELLESFGRTALITDTAGRRDVLHMRLTSPTVMVRWAGNNLHPTDYSRLDAWVERITAWIQAGVHTIYFFIHVPEEFLGPQLINYFIENLNQSAGLDLKKWKSYQDMGQQSLF